MITLTYLEFYSGIGGWGYALEQACRSIQAASSTTSMDQIQKHDSRRTNLISDNIPQGDVSTDVLKLDMKLLAAYDHSDLCISVLMHNHKVLKESTLSSNKLPQYKTRQTPIEKITKHELETHAAAIWCMSPPCQPHTRQHSNQLKESDDPRSKSFLYLCNMLTVMKEETLPCLILLENVVGFESLWKTDCIASNSEMNGIFDTSNTTSHQRRETQEFQESKSPGSFMTWRAALSRRHYHVAHFHLDPTNFGIPNSRPRYYAIAFRRGSLSKWLIKNGFSNITSPRPDCTKRFDSLFSREVLDEPPLIHIERSLGTLSNDKILSRYYSSVTPCLNTFLDKDLVVQSSSTQHSEKIKALQIPDKVRNSTSSWCFDVVTPYHTHTSCFTHSYGKFIRGTGSILYTGSLQSWKDGTNEDKYKSAVLSINKFHLESPQERIFDENWSAGIDWNTDMRFFSGTEIARLFGFPVSEPETEVNFDHPCVNEATSIEQKWNVRTFNFPEKCSMKQQWKLLGNSLNVRVAACVANVGIEVILSDVINQEYEIT